MACGVTPQSSVDAPPDIQFDRILVFTGAWQDNPPERRLAVPRRIAAVGDAPEDVPAVRPQSKFDAHGARGQPHGE